MDSLHEDRQGKVDRHPNRRVGGGRPQRGHRHGWPQLRFWWEFDPIGKNAQGLREYQRRGTRFVYVRYSDGSLWPLPVEALTESCESASLSFAFDPIDRVHLVSFPRGKRLALLLAALAVAVLGVAAWRGWPHLRFWWLFEPLGKNAQGYPEYRHRRTGIVMVRVPGGTFWMGGDGRGARRGAWILGQH